MQSIAEHGFFKGINILALAVTTETATISCIFTGEGLLVLVTYFLHDLIITM